MTTLNAVVTLNAANGQKANRKLQWKHAWKQQINCQLSYFSFAHGKTHENAAGKLIKALRTICAQLY